MRHLFLLSQEQNVNGLIFLGTLVANHSRKIAYTWLFDSHPKISSKNATKPQEYTPSNMPQVWRFTRESRSFSVLHRFSCDRSSFSKTNAGETVHSGNVAEMVESHTVKLIISVVQIVYRPILTEYQFRNCPFSPFFKNFWSWN